jgi:glycosyltransferase
MFRLGHQPPHPGFFVRKSVYNKFGFFDTNFKLGADFDMMLRLIGKHNLRTKYCPWVSVLMRGGGASQNSLSNISRANKEVNQSLKNNGYFSTIMFVWLKYPLKIFQYLLR